MSNKWEENVKRLRACDEDQWRTIKGAHVLIGSDGTIKGGAGGKLNGRKIGMKALSSGSKGVTTGTAKKQALQSFTNKADRASGRIESERQRAYAQGKSIFANENVAQEERGVGQAGIRLAERMNELGNAEKAGNSPEQKLKGAAYLASAAKSGSGAALGLGNPSDLPQQNSPAVQAIANKVAKKYGGAFELGNSASPTTGNKDIDSVIDYYTNNGDIDEQAVVDGISSRIDSGDSPAEAVKNALTDFKASSRTSEEMAGFKKAMSKISKEILGTTASSSPLQSLASAASNTQPSRITTNREKFKKMNNELQKDVAGNGARRYMSRKVGQYLDAHPNVSVAYALNRFISGKLHDPHYTHLGEALETNSVAEAKKLLNEYSREDLAEAMGEMGVKPKKATSPLGAQASTASSAKTPKADSKQLARLQKQYVDLNKAYQQVLKNNNLPKDMVNMYKEGLKERAAKIRALGGKITK